MAAARAHPRVESCDSQAYGVAVRQDARKQRIGKPDTYVAAVMRDWFVQQSRLMATPASPRKPAAWPPRQPAAPVSDIDARVATAAEELRALIETGEIEWSDVGDLAAYQFAFLDNDDEDGEAA